MAISKVILNGETQMDVTTDTVAANNLLSGNTATGADGQKVQGGIQSRSDSDLTASGATVTAPAGYYQSSASKSVATATHANPTASVNSSTGLVTASHTQSAGYVSSGTTTGTLQLATQAAATITPSTSSQTAVPAGRYTTGAVTVAAMPSGTAGTPTASKGTVSNHSVTVTPSVTNTTGYITGGTRTGIDVTVTASELASGNKVITENGTGIDVVGYSTVSVDVQAWGDTFIIELSQNSATQYWEPDCTFAEMQAAYNNGQEIVLTCHGDSPNVSGRYDDSDECLYYVVTWYDYSDLKFYNNYYIFDSNGVTDGGGGAISTSIEPLTVTTNGTYTAPSGTAYTPVTVNVPSGGGYSFEDFVGRTQPTGRVEINNLSTVPSYGIVGFNGITSIFSDSINYIDVYGVYNNANLEILVFANNSISFGSNNAVNGNAKLEIIDITSPSSLGTGATTFRNNPLFDTLIIRGNSVSPLARYESFLNTPFASDGTGGTLYVPQALIASYQAQGRWSIILGYPNNQILPIEGSQYENYYADGTPVPTT